MSDPIRIDNSYQVVLKIGTTPAVDKALKFPEIDQLRNKKIYAMRVCPVEYLTVDNQGNTPIARADLPKLLFTFQYAGSDNTQPLQDIVAMSFDPNSNDLQSLPRFNNITINWPQSFAKFTNVTGVALNESIVLEVYYR